MPVPGRSCLRVVSFDCFVTFVSFVHPRSLFHCPPRRRRRCCVNQPLASVVSSDPKTHNSTPADVRLCGNICRQIVGSAGRARQAAEAVLCLPGNEAGARSMHGAKGRGSLRSRDCCTQGTATARRHRNFSHSRHPSVPCCLTATSTPPAPPPIRSPIPLSPFYRLVCGQKVSICKYQKKQERRAQKTPPSVPPPPSALVFSRFLA